MTSGPTFNSQIQLILVPSSPKRDSFRETVITFFMHLCKQFYKDTCDLVTWIVWTIYQDGLAAQPNS